MRRLIVLMVMEIAVISVRAYGQNAPIQIKDIEPGDIRCLSKISSSS